MDHTSKSSLKRFTKVGTRRTKEPLDFQILHCLCSVFFLEKTVKLGSIVGVKGLVKPCQNPRHTRLS